MRTCTVLMLIACLVASCLIVLVVPSVSAQENFKPSVPQFSVKVIDKSYSGTNTVDRSMEVSIKNQQFTPYTDANGDAYNLYYTAQYRTESSAEQDEGWGEVYYQPFVQSDSQYTAKRCVLYGFDESIFGSWMEFRVKVELGCLKNYYNTDGYMLVGSDFVVVASSGWSSIQKVTVTDESWTLLPSQTATWPSVSSDGNGQSQYPDQTQPSNSIFSNPFVLFGAGVLFASVVIAVMLVVLRKQFKTSIISGATDLYA